MTGRKLERAERRVLCGSLAAHPLGRVASLGVGGLEVVLLPGPTSHQPERQELAVGPTTAAAANDPAATVRDAAPTDWHLRPSRRRVVAAVARKLVPYLVEATIIPTALFYVLLMVGDMRWALAGALVWSYGAIVRRAVRGRPVPGLLILATIGITVRTIVYLLSNNDFVYFVGPILRTTLTGLVFAVSVVLGRPLIARFAGDFCPLTPDVSVRPGIMRLFTRLTILWATVNGLAAASSLVLLLTVPVGVFVVTAAVSAWIVTCTGVVLTVVDSVTTARREGLVTALSSDGRLYAATEHPAIA